MGCYPAALTRCVVTWNKKLDTHHCTTQKINALFPKDGILYMLLWNCSRIFLYATLPFYNKDFLLTFLQFFFYERWQASCYDIRYCISTKSRTLYDTFVGIYFTIKSLSHFDIRQKLLFNSYFLNLWSSLCKW